MKENKFIKYVWSLKNIEDTTKYNICLEHIKDKYADLYKTYRIYIKSHDEAPDYEAICDAPDKESAAKEFQKRINQYGEDWGLKEILNFTEEI
jgi:hypothetical protein